MQFMKPTYCHRLAHKQVNEDDTVEPLMLGKVASYYYLRVRVLVHNFPRHNDTQQ